MTPGAIQQVLPSIALAHLFYEYGKLDAMIKEGYAATKGGLLW